MATQVGQKQEKGNLIPGLAAAGAAVTAGLSWKEGMELKNVAAYVDSSNINVGDLRNQANAVKKVVETGKGKEFVDATKNLLGDDANTRKVVQALKKNASNISKMSDEAFTTAQETLLNSSEQWKDSVGNLKDMAGKATETVTQLFENKSLNSRQIATAAAVAAAVAVGTFVATKTLMPPKPQIEPQGHTRDTVSQQQSHQVSA